jgi:hypothetical protein
MAAVAMIYLGSLAAQHSPIGGGPQATPAVLVAIVTVPDSRSSWSIASGDTGSSLLDVQTTRSSWS